MCPGPATRGGGQSLTSLQTEGRSGGYDTSHHRRQSEANANRPDCVWRANCQVHAAFPRAEFLGTSLADGGLKRHT
jgi:hypothetical protein